MIVGHVTGQSLRLHHSAIADKTIDYLEAQFIFRTDDWKAMTTIKAVFELDGEEYAIPLTEDGRIRKEDHLNLSEGLWRVHLVGSRYDGEDVVERITTTQDVLRIMPTGGVDGDVLPEIPVTDVERLEARLDEIEENGGGDDKYVSGYRMVTYVDTGTHWLVLEFSDGTEMEIKLPEMGIDIDRVVQFGTEDPTGETAGETKQLYINTSTGKMWVCKNGMMWPTQWISLSGGEDTGGGIPSPTPEDEGAYLTVRDGKAAWEQLPKYEGESNVGFSDAECRVAFIGRMNEKAAEIGMSNTIFKDPAGRENISTAHDMARCLLHASGYERLNEIWNTPEKDILFIKPDGSVRTNNVVSTVVGKQDCKKLTDHYNVMGGKTGTISNSVFNLTCICQSNKNPMDWYAVAVLAAYTNDAGDGSRYTAVKETMDLIESGEVVTGDPLDEIAYGGLTYRDIFINNNLAPNINSNSMVSKTGDTYTDSAGSTSIETNENAESNYVPPYSLYVSGTTSQQAKGSREIVKGARFFFAANIKVTSYAAGKIGLVAVSTGATIDRVTNGFETVTAVVENSRDTGKLYIGSMSSANLTGYINNPVIVDMSLFATAPSEEELTVLYNNYNAMLIEMYEGGYSGTGNPINPCANNICVFKLPYHNARALKSSSLAPMYKKNAGASVKPASTTKIMTSMVLLDYVSDLHAKVVLTQEDIDALTVSSSGWYAEDILLGESITYEDLLYIMMLPSSNIASEIISRVVGAKILRSKTL